VDARVWFAAVAESLKPAGRGTLERVRVVLRMLT